MADDERRFDGMRPVAGPSGHRNDLGIVFGLSCLRIQLDDLEARPEGTEEQPVTTRTSKTVLIIGRHIDCSSQVIQHEIHWERDFRARLKPESLHLHNRYQKAFPLKRVRPFCGVRDLLQTEPGDL